MQPREIGGRPPATLACRDLKEIRGESGEIGRGRAVDHTLLQNDGMASRRGSSTGVSAMATAPGQGSGWMRAGKIEQRRNTCEKVSSGWRERYQRGAARGGRHVGGGVGRWERRLPEEP